MKKLFVVTPSADGTTNVYPWFAFGKTIEEVEARFPGCTVEEDM
jgi:hypothetical protein